MRLRDLVKYAAIYLLSYVGAVAGTTILIWLIGSLQGATLSYLFPLVAAMITMRRFMSDHMRLATTTEYWSLVVMSVTISVTFDFSIAWALTPITRTEPYDPWIIMLLASFAILQSLIISMTFYNRFFGRRYLASVGKSGT